MNINKNNNFSGLKRMFISMSLKYRYQWVMILKQNNKTCLSPLEDIRDPYFESWP